MKVVALMRARLRVKAILRDKFVVVAALDDLAVAQYKYLAGIANGAEAVSDDEAGAIGH